MRVAMATRHIKTIFQMDTKFLILVEVVMNGVVSDIKFLREEDH
jgi:hypothetical protein